MNKYHILLRGENFFIENVDKENKCGFYTTIFLEARDDKEAEKKAIEIIRNDKELSESTQNRQDDPPMLYVDEINELEEDAVLEKVQGKTFFVEDN